MARVERVVLVSDCESDFYEYMAAPRPANAELLFRVHHLQRYVHCQGERVRLGAAGFANATAVAVWLPKTKKRPERPARLQVSWGPVVCPLAAHKKGESVALWLVQGLEQGPPQGQEPVEWHLLSTIPVEDQATALLLLDYYRRRWAVERWHLVLKDGLKVERLQFDTFRRLYNAIALLSVVA